MSLHTISIDEALAALPAFPALRSRCARLRPPDARDADALFALFSHAEVTRFWTRPPMHDRVEAEGLLAEIEEAFAARSMLHWMVALPADHRAVGTCALFRFQPQRRSAEIGYALHPDQWGRGLAAQAVSLALDWGFGTLCLHRIEASVDPRNERSRRLLRRLGFHSEGLVPARAAGEDDAERFALSAPAGRAAIR